MSFNPNTFTNDLTFGQILDPNQFLETRMINNDSGQLLYVGFSPIAGADTSASIWYVLAFAYDDNNYLNYKQLPNNGPGFIYIWDDVATYF